MNQDEIEVHLKSSEPAGSYNPEVSLQITAYLREGNEINSNTLTFYCNPIGTNYKSSYLQVTFGDWSKVMEIRDFLADCFSNDITSRQAMSP